MIRRRFLAGLVCGVILTLGQVISQAIETARIDASAGAPRLMIDGKPVRARIFWGGPGSRPLPIKAGAQELDFEFSPTETEPAKATMHLRFGETAGDIYLDDIHIRDVTAGQDVMSPQAFEKGQADFTSHWTSWPVGPQNTVGTIQVEPGCGRNGSGGLHVKLTAPPKGSAWPDFHIYHHANLALQRGHRYQVRLWVRAEPARNLTISFYRPGTQYVFLGGPSSPFVEQIKLAAAVGVDLVSFPMMLPWPKPGEKVDWTSVDVQCQAVLDVNPRALLLPRIGMWPAAWWRQAHPEEMMVWDQGTNHHNDAVVASPIYRHDAAERLSALVRHLEEKFGPHMLGYHPAGQNTDEWFYQDTWGSALNGYAKADQRAWRAWLAGRYANDAVLRAAWRDGQVTREMAVVPTPAARRASPAGNLRDPVAERPLIDFAEFQQEMMAGCVGELARAVRQASGGKKLVFFFFGYVFEFGPVHNGPATAGHYAMRSVLASPDIDVLCSPISYYDRGLGHSAPAMTAAESVALAGKMWLYEDDTRTYLGTGTAPGWYDAVDTIEKTNQELLRNTGQCALRNFGTWWMDLGTTGWFNDPRMWAEMARLKALDEPLMTSPRPFQPEVAAVIHERSMVRVAFGGDAVTRPGVYEVRRPLGRMGAPYGQYFLEDVAAGRVGAKMHVFLTAWCLSPAERRQLLDATQKSLRVWCYAPGYQEANGTSLEAMRELTGFTMKQVSPEKAQAEPTDRGRAIGLHESLGVNKPVKPLFAAADATPEETLATYSDGSAAVALRRTASGTNLFVGPPGLTSELLRLAARQAGVHLWTQSDCNVYANGPFLVLHASNDGPLELDTGRAEPIRDLLTGRPVGQGPKITLPMTKGDTHVLVVGQK